VNELKVGACASAVSVETPFAHIAIHASKAVNCSAQDEEFLGKPAVFRVHLASAWNFRQSGSIRPN
jgi:hypothetical protein